MARLIAKIIVRMCWQSSLNEAEQFEPRNVKTNFLSIPNVTSRLNNFYFIGKNHFFLVIDANKWTPLPWMFRNTKNPRVYTDLTQFLYVLMNLLFLRYTIRINQFIFIYLKSILLDKYTTERPKSQHFPV
jgi:hypothetical protein